MLEHMGTPWSKDIRCRIGPRFETDDQSDGMIDDILEVYGENREAYAAFIIKAVNGHEALVKALEAACGYLLNAKIDLETGCTKATAIKMIEGGLNRARQALRDHAGGA